MIILFRPGWLIWLDFVFPYIHIRRGHRVKPAPEGVIIPKGIALPPDSEGYTIHHNVVYPDDGAREFGNTVSLKVSDND